MLLGCPSAEEQSEASTPGRPARRSGVRVQRAIDPPSGSVITGGLPRAQLGAEARTVLASAPRTVLRWRERVSLRGDLELELELPEKLAESSWLRIDAWVSVRDPEPRQQKRAQLRTGGRFSLTADPVVLTEAAAGGRVTVRLQVPES